MAFIALETNMGMSAGELEVSLIMIERKSLLECLCTMTLFARFRGILFGKLLGMDVFVA